MYSINEIIDIAIGMEEAGYDFYTGCVKKFSDKVIQDLFQFLADEELVHNDIFKSLKDGNENPAGEFTEEYYTYMKSIGGGKIFAETIDKRADMSEISTPKDAIKKAFHDEKEAILFYSEMKSYYKNDEKITGLLDKIIAEERNHVNKLFDTMKFIEE